MMKRLSAFAVAMVLVTSSGSAEAAESDTEARLREALRSAITQQRALEDERVALMAKQSEYERQIQALKAQLETAAKSPAPEPSKSSASQEEVAALAHRLDTQAAEAARLSETLAKMRAAYSEAADSAKTKEAERAALAKANEDLRKQALVCVDKNVALYRVGAELLGRYAAMDLGDTLSAREPFLGLKRVELQTLVQDYQDKLLDQRIAQ